MSKFGITLLPAALPLLTGSTIYPQSRSYQPKTYEPSQHIDGAGIFDSMTNMAQLLTTHVGPGGVVATTTSCGTAGVSTTITTTGTGSFVSPCTGNLTVSVWGAGSSAYLYGGGGAFAQSVLAVTTGQTFTTYVGAGPAPPSSVGYNSFICPASNSFCTKAKQNISGTCVSGGTTGLSTTNFVCAQGGQGFSGGYSASSVGTTKFSGGSYASGGGSGGAAGPDGAGKNASGTTGGAGDNGSGGAGGTIGKSGVSNVKGGGGSGGATGVGAIYGGAPGGGSAYIGSGGKWTGGQGQIKIQSRNDIEQPGAVSSAGTIGMG
jgi:hypothetical protein